MENSTTNMQSAKLIRAENNKTALQDYFKEVIYGGIDGIVTTFAVVAGFSGAALSGDVTTQMSFLVVLLFGLANLFADAASMGLGNFLSVRSEQDLYKVARTKEQKEINDNSDDEYKETITLMMERGFSEADAIRLADIYRTNEEYWIDFMMTHEHEMPDPRGENPALTGLATFGSFLVFGAIPLLPFIFMESGDAHLAFRLSIVGTMLALASLGLLKWRVIGSNFIASMIEVMVVGGTAATLAFFVGTFFQI